MQERVVGKVCNLCEAMCGLRIHVAGREVRRIEPDPDDPLSAGAICPKAIGLKELHEDPDRVKRPLRRRGTDWEEISWDEALGETAERLARIQKRDGSDAVASYLGNPGAHNLGTILGLSPLYRVLDSRNRYSASSLDQNPQHATSVLLFGNFLSIPVPDVDRTDFLLMLGANPLASGGSLMTAPGFRRRMRALRERGGRVVVVDPRRTETAREADEHWFIRPGADGLLLASLVHTVLDEKLGRASPALSRCDGHAALAEALGPLSPEAVESALGIEATRVRELARRFAAAPSAVCYGRVGTSQHPFGTLATWLQSVLNLVTGNLDQPGGSMFPAPAADLAALARMRGETGHLSRWTTRVRGAPCFNGEAPTPCLAEEITTPGSGQVRGLLAIAGNPVLSAPNGASLGRALAGLEFFAAVDFYVNETTRHAHVLLPPMSSLEHENYEILFHGFAVRNTARYSPVVVPPEPGQRDDFAILTELTWRLGAQKASSRGARLAFPLLRHVARQAPPERLLDWMLRLGPYGDGFRPWRRGLRLAELRRRPSGVDLGPLAPRLDEVLGSPEARIELLPEVMRSELARLAAGLDTPRPEGLVLIGRRDVRTNNSWLHNTRVGTKGRARCTLLVHPDDADRLGLAGAERVRVTSRVGSLVAPLELSDDLMPGVVSLPHGWGHVGPGLRLRVARQHAGVSCNDLVDDAVLEPVVGNAVFNGVPVELEPLA